jgi:general secretion pathway protein D
MKRWFRVYLGLSVALALSARVLPQEAFEVGELPAAAAVDVIVVDDAGIGEVLNPPDGEVVIMEPPEGGPVMLPSPGAGEFLVLPGEAPTERGAPVRDGAPTEGDAPSAAPGRAPAPESQPTMGTPGNLNRLRERVAAEQIATAQSTPPRPVVANGGAGSIRLNFKDAPLSQVLSYLSEAAGFVIVHEQELRGTISITSHQPITSEEAVDLLNAVLVEKGYAAVRTGRILKIVSRSQALTMDLPVRAGADPQLIPKKDELVTQIIPVRYAEAAKLIENIRPLLEEDAALTANESSNAIVLTDTLTNIRRIAQIIQALDTSIASISVVRVFPLQYADAAEVAEVIKEVFASSTSTSGREGFRRMMEERFRMGGRGGGGATSGTSEARQASSRVVAVADEYTNSLVVSAPDELMPTIEEIVMQLDSNIADVTEVRVFRLEHADAAELADLINEVYYDSTTSAGTTRGGRQFGPGAFFGRGRPSNNTDQRSQRSLLQARVIAVGDPRTNSLIVSAARETMMTIAEMIGRLDASSDKKQKVFVMPLEHADVDNVAEVLRGMFETGTTSGTGARRTTAGTTTSSRLSQRVTQGASSANTTFNNTRGAGGGGR